MRRCRRQVGCCCYITSSRSWAFLSALPPKESDERCPAGMDPRRRPEPEPLSRSDGPQGIRYGPTGVRSLQTGLVDPERGRQGDRLPRSIKGDDSMQSRCLT